MNPTIKNHKDKIVGYKAFRKDEKGIYTDGMGNSEKVYFEEGKSYKVKGEPVLCKNGYHFFRHFCFAIDYLETGNIIYKVEILGKVQEDTEKAVTNHLKILNIEYQEDFIKDDNLNSGDMNSGYVNSGDRNSGYRNSGDMNSGDMNSGNMNSGNRNSGDRNSGDMNSGNMNSGYMNSGDMNSGYRNSGDRNSGYRNSGDMNSGDGYINSFCTKTKYFLFDIECTKKEANEIYNLDFSWFDLTDKTYKEAWGKCPKSVLGEIKKLRNFNREIFKEITGI